MRKTTLIALALGGVLLAGCGSKPSLEGDWKITGLKPGQIPAGTDMAMTMNFKSPSSTLKIKGTSEAMGQKFDLDMSAPGTFAVEGDRLKITFTDFVINSSNAMVMTYINKGFAQQKPAMIKAMNDNSSGKLTWVDNNKFTVESASGPVTYERVTAK